LHHQFIQIHPSSELLLFWPVTVVHSITAESPLNGISADRLTLEKFEIIVTLEGTTESTNMATQSSTSYKPKQILWGYRFEDIFTLKSNDAKPTFDSPRIDKVYFVAITHNLSQ